MGTVITQYPLHTHTDWPFLSAFLKLTPASQTPSVMCYDLGVGSCQSELRLQLAIKLLDGGSGRERKSPQRKIHPLYMGSSLCMQGT